MRMYSHVQFICRCLIISLLISSSLHTYAEDENTVIDYTLYGELLSKYVDDKGFVNYKGLQSESAKLNKFLQIMNNVKESDYNKWSEEDQIAYWSNAYNVFTLKAILDNYPIKAGWIGSLRFPKNSIRQISGVWDTLTFGAMGKQLTLNAIEHEILRVKFIEPRIHVAIVCASIGCPPLRNEPFTGEKLEEQLNDQSKRFIAHPQNFKIDKNSGYVYLSSILSWFGEDFVAPYGTQDKFKHLGQTERAVINYAYEYARESDKKYLESNKFGVAYSDYDWTLNEQ